MANFDSKAAQLASELEALKQGLCAEIRKLPDNPAVTFLDEHKRCGVISSRELAMHGNWSAEFHLFGSQYTTLVEIIQATETVRVVPILQEVIINGCYRWRGDTIKFHPVVRWKLAELLKKEV